MWKRIVATILCACLLVGIGCGSGATVEQGSADNINQNTSTEKDTGIENLADGDLPVEAPAKEEIPTDTPTTDIQVTQTVNLMENVEPISVDLDSLLPSIPIMRFGLPLFQNALKEAAAGENVLVSPLSAMVALQMTSLGAEGNTLKQMQKVLCDEAVSAYMEYFSKHLPRGEGYKVNLANGIWLKNTESLQVKMSFLQFNKQFYDAAVYKAPFNEDTLDEINAWVSDNTDGMIPGILEEIKEEDIMYLINALCFDAEWRNIYNEHDIWNDIFITESGEEQLVPMMHSEESVYLEDSLATGVVKYYKDDAYAFVALLPKEGVTVAEYVESLTPEHLQELLKNPTYGPVETTIPKFTTEYSIKLNDILVQMGMKDAFSEAEADFSGMANSDLGNIFISNVLQKTFISVDERGTKAGAATVVTMANESIVLSRKVVNLNRPFVYLLIECEYNEPLFIGTMMDVAQ